MSNHNEMVKQQLVHMFIGCALFVALAGIAVALDLAAAYVLKLGVSQFTHSVISLSAHGLLILDLVLFAVYLVKSSFNMLKEMF